MTHGIRQKSLTWLTLMVLVTVTAWWLWLKVNNPATLPLHSIKVEGRYTHIDAKGLQRTILPFVTTQGFFSVDVAALREQLITLPWVAVVSVSRLWPDSIIVKIVEQQANANWQGDSLLNEKGEVFYPNKATFPSGLPQLNGPNGQSLQVYRDYQAITHVLSPLGLAITELDLTARRSMRLKLSNGVEVLLGQIDPLDKLQRFVQIYDQVFKGKIEAAQRIDLRYGSGMAVQWKRKIR